MKKFFTNDIVKRALKTFLQGFLASLIVSLKSMTSFDETMLKSIILGAIAGGLSALMNFILTLINKGDE